jgi:DNA-binding NarL/FixJ family response regulator
MDALRVISSQLPETKTIILTTYDTDDLLFTAIRHGAKGYLLKNTPIAKLTAAIRALERGEAAISRGMAGRLVEEFSRTMAGLEPTQNGTSSLTQREREIFALLGTGAANREIASRLSIAENTVKIHVHNILEKLNLNSRTEAGRLARYLLLGQVSQEMP